MPNIFISYRRADSEQTVGRIYDHLEREFGHASLFLDVSGLTLGEAFQERIRSEIERSSVVLIIMGRSWSSIKDKDGNVRLQNPDDPVKFEVETALEQKRIRNLEIIPVLVDSAQMPDKENLPISIQDVLGLNALTIRNGQGFKEDIPKLINWLEQYFTSLPATKEKNTRRNRLIFGAVLSTIILIAVIIALLLRPPNLTLDDLAKIALESTATFEAGSTLTQEYQDKIETRIAGFVTGTHSAHLQATADLETATFEAIIGMTSTVHAVETQTILNKTETMEAQNRLNTQAAANIPTDTPQPTETSTSLPTSTANPINTELAPTFDATRAFLDAAATQARQPTDIPTATSKTATVTITSSSGANIRKGPGEDYDILDKATNGKIYVVTESYTRGGYTWYHIKYSPYSQAWIADTSIVKFTSNGVSVPRASSIPATPIPTSQAAQQPQNSVPTTAGNKGSAPSIVDIYWSQGDTCFSFTNHISWMDPDGDADYIEYVDIDNGAVSRLASVKGKSGVVSYPGVCPGGFRGCYYNIRIVDKAGNKSPIFYKLFSCVG